MTESIFTNATVDEKFVRPPAYWTSVIKFQKSLDLDMIKENLSVEGGDKTQCLSIRTEFGTIQVKSPHCIQLNFVKTPADLEMLYRFINDLLYNGERRRWTDWLKDDWKRFEKDLGLLEESR